MGYIFDWSVVANWLTATAILSGLQLTLLVSLMAMLLGSFVGMLVAFARLWGPGWLKSIAYVYVDLFRATPPLVQLIWIYYVGPMLIGINMSAITAGVIALSLNAGAFLSEVFRAGLQSIDKGQTDASIVLGLTRRQSLYHIILPQALKRVAPAVTNIFMSLIKDSALLSVIGVTEVTYNMQSMVNQTFRPFELYTALVVVYLILTYPLSIITTILERRFKEK